MGGLGLKVANKSTDIVRILNYEEKVHMRGFNYEMADIYGVKVLCACWRGLGCTMPPASATAVPA